MVTVVLPSSPFPMPVSNVNSTTVSPAKSGTCAVTDSLTDGPCAVACRFTCRSAAGALLAVIVNVTSSPRTASAWEDTIVSVGSPSAPCTAAAAGCICASNSKRTPKKPTTTPSARELLAIRNETLLHHS